MPTRAEIQLYLSRLRRVPDLSTLPDPVCPICFERYAPESTTRMDEGRPEYAVRVLSLNPVTACTHAFGRHCIEQHFRSGGPWCTKCPTCRENWFPDSDASSSNDRTRQAADGVAFVRMQIPRAVRAVSAMGQVGETNDAWIDVVVPRSDVVVNVGVVAAEVDAQSTLSDDRSPWDSLQPEREEGAQTHAAPPNIQSRGGTGTTRLSSRQAISNAVVYLERSLLTAAVDEENEELRRAVEDVSRASQSLWFRLEEMARERENSDAPQPTPVRSSVQATRQESLGTRGIATGQISAHTGATGSETDGFRLPFERIGWGYGGDTSGIMGGTRILYA